MNSVSTFNDAYRYTILCNIVVIINSECNNIKITSKLSQISSSRLLFRVMFFDSRWMRCLMRQHNIMQQIRSTYAASFRRVM